MLKTETSFRVPDSMPFLIFRRNHLRSGIICGAVQFEVVHLHLKLKKRDFRMEHSEIHFVLLPWAKTLHKPNWW